MHGRRISHIVTKYYTILLTRRYLNICLARAYSRPYPAAADTAAAGSDKLLFSVDSSALRPISFWWVKVSEENIIIITTPVRYCTVGECWCTRSPAGRPPPPARRASWCLPVSCAAVDAFFKVFSSGLETKERIGTECQRPTRSSDVIFIIIIVLLLLFQVKRSKFLSALNARAHTLHALRLNTRGIRRDSLSPELINRY